MTDMSPTPDAKAAQRFATLLKQKIQRLPAVGVSCGTVRPGPADHAVAVQVGDEPFGPECWPAPAVHSDPRHREAGISTALITEPL